MPEMRPLYPAHAVERCSMTVSFLQELPNKPFEKLSDALKNSAASKGFTVGPNPPTFGMDPATGQVTNLNVAGVALNANDGHAQLLIEPSSITWVTTQYVRWAPAKAQFEAIAAPLIEEYTQIVDFSSAKVEYWDRFFWTGDWTDFDKGQLFPENSEFISQKSSHSPREWHSHCGWFDYHEDFRRLVNVNVDVVGLVKDGVQRPTVGIYTMLNDHTKTEALSRFGDPMAKLDELHAGLKELLKNVITPAMAIKIGLEKGRSS